jgi:hypothetical protein
MTDGEAGAPPSIASSQFLCRELHHLIARAPLQRLNRRHRPLRWVLGAPMPQNGILGPVSRSWRDRPAHSSPATLARPGRHLGLVSPASKPVRAGEEAWASGRSQAVWPISGRPVG